MEYLKCPSCGEQLYYVFEAAMRGKAVKLDGKLCFTKPEVTNKFPEHGSLNCYNCVAVDISEYGRSTPESGEDLVKLYEDTDEPEEV